MDKLIELLKANGLEPNVDELRANVKALGFDPDRLTAPQIGSIAEQILKTPASNLVPISQSKPTAGKSGKVTRRGKPKAETNGLADMARQIDAEMAAFEDGLNEFTGQQIQARKQRIMQTLQDAPVELVQQVAQECAEFGGDPEFFRSAARVLCEGFSPLDPVLPPNTVAS